MWHEFTELDHNKPISIDLTKVAAYMELQYHPGYDPVIDATVVYTNTVTRGFIIKTPYKEFKTIMQGVNNV